MTPYLAVHGTWGWPAKPGDWWLEDSAIRRYLALAELEPWRPADPFLWSGDLNGRWPWSDRNHTDWYAAGKALNWYIRGEDVLYVPIADRRVISHSHGLQVVLYACANGLKIDCLLSLTAPIRGDMAKVARAARPNIRRWVHVHADDDWTQVFGAVTDGVWGINRQAVWGDVRADEQIAIPGVGHSGLLREPLHFHWWHDAGLIPFLTEAG